MVFAQAQGRDEVLVAALSDDKNVVAEVARCADEVLAPRSKGWRSCFGQLDSDGRSATLVFESRIQSPAEMVCVHVARTAKNLRDASAYQKASIGWLRVKRLSEDPRLATLPGFLKAHPEAVALRYRPERRCTFRARSPSFGPAIAKLFPDQRGAEVHEIGETFRLWAEADPRRVGIACSYGWDPVYRVQWQELLPARPVIADLLAPKGSVLARKMGAALGELACSGVPLPSVLDSGAQLARSVRYMTRLSQLVPELATRSEELIQHLRGIHARSRNPRLVPIHGSPHAHQWLNSESGLALVDFDRSALGDPELDVATFLAEIDYEDPEAAPLEEIRSGFLSGYESRFGKLDRGRLAAYRAHKHLSKAAKSARSIRRNGARRAKLYLKRAVAAIDRDPTKGLGDVVS